MTDTAKQLQDGINYKSISCEQIPVSFLDKIIAKQYFSEFGNINRFILNPKRHSCIVEYETEEAAKMALTYAGDYKGEKFNVQLAKREQTHVQNTEQWVNPDVQAELDAMKSLNSPYSNVQDAMFGARFARPITDQLLPSSRRKYSSATNSTACRELEDILRRPAYTEEEKYRVLDARDKLIRLTTVKQTDIKKVSATKGYCPDMCPEKERLMREFQHQVSPFEASLDGITISHKLAIKEYARSSADQEMPLAHELRSEPVLQMTMQYLMHNIMDLCDDEQTSLADWFHFVWDRTRSIRKDITQQELCSLSAVELVEQCARFHIHCAARLVAEEPSVFDTKINAENLTKCLQTLKYMYQDLRIRNVRCPNETEFRSYIVLLNLGNANFMWELQKLPEDILHAKEIKRAVSFYNVLQANNYVRFFQMVRSTDTSYMSACILLSYFNKLRTRALETIVSSFNKRNNTRSLPLAYLTDVLGFEDAESAVCFLQSFGMRCEDDCVHLDRIIYPETEFGMDRALLLVESKRTTSTGECIAGTSLKSMETFNRHIPHNSFDSNNILKLNAWNAEDQQHTADGEKCTTAPRSETFSTDERLTPINAESNIFKVPQLLPIAMSAKQQQQPITMPILPAVIAATTAAVATTTTQSLFTPKAALDTTNDKNIFSFKFEMKTDTNFKTEFDEDDYDEDEYEYDHDDHYAAENDDNVEDFEQIVIDEDDNEQFDQMEQIAAITNEADIENEIEEVEMLQEQQNDVVATIESTKEAAVHQRLDIDGQLIYDEMLSDLIADVVHSFKRKQEEQSKQACEQLIDEVISENLNSLMMEEYKVAKFYHQLLLSATFRRWREYVKTIKNQSKLLKMTLPVWLTTETRESQTAQLRHPSEMHNLQMIKRYRHGEPCDFKMLLWHDMHAAQLHQQCQQQQQTRTKLNMLHVVLQSLLQQQLKRQIDQAQCSHTTYMKLVFTLPKEMEELHGFESLCNKWLQKYVVNEKSPMCKEEPFYCAATQQLVLCVRKLCGINSLNEYAQRVSVEADNANGIICFMSCLNLSNTQQRLHNLMQMLKQRGKCTPMPIAFILFDAVDYDDEQQLHAALSLHKLTAAEQLLSYKFIGCGQSKSCFNFVAALTQALEFVASEYALLQQALQPLEMQQLNNWLATSLGEEMWQRWYETAATNAAFEQMCQQPQNIIALHNEALQKLEQIVMEDFSNYPELPIELQNFVTTPNASKVVGVEYFPNNWKHRTRQQNIVKLLRKLQMPAMQLPNACEQTWERLQLYLLDYATLCLPADSIVEDCNVIKVAHACIKSLQQQLQDIGNQLQMEHALEALKFVNWLPVLRHLIFAFIDCTIITYENELLPAEVIYRRQAMLDYCKQPWWLNCRHMQTLKIDWTPFSLQERISSDEPKDINDQEHCEQQILQTIQKAELLCRNVEEKLSQQQQTVNASDLKLLSRLQSKLDESIYKFELEKTLSEIQLKEQYRQLQLDNNNTTSTSDRTYNKRKRLASNEYDDVIERAKSILQNSDEQEFKENYKMSF